MSHRRCMSMTALVLAALALPASAASARPQLKLVTGTAAERSAERLGQKATLDVAALPARVAVRAVGMPRRVRSVRFCVDKRCRVDNRRPFVLLSRGGDGIVHRLGDGRHRLKVSGFRRRDAQGARLGRVRTRLRVVDRSPAQAPVPAAAAASPAAAPVAQPQAAPPAPAQPAQPAGVSLFGDVWGGDGSCAVFLRTWAQCHEGAADRISVGDWSGRRAVVMRVADGDVAPLTPTQNPRAQLNSRNLFFEGMTTEVSWGTSFGADYPMNPAWSVFYQFHGSPYSGSPRIGFGVTGGRINMSRDDVYGYDRPWWGPAVVPGRWYDFDLVVKWSKDPSVGWVQLAVDGVAQTFANGSTRLPMATIQSDQAGVENIVANYRARGAAAWATTATSEVTIQQR